MHLRRVSAHSKACGIGSCRQFPDFRQHETARTLKIGTVTVRNALVRIYRHLRPTTTGKHRDTRSSAQRHGLARASPQLTNRMRSETPVTRKDVLPKLGGTTVCNMKTANVRQ